MNTNSEKIKKADSKGLSYYSRKNPQLYSLDETFLKKTVTRLKNDPLFLKSLSLLDLQKENKLIEVGGGRCEPSVIFADYVFRVYCLEKNPDELCGLEAAKKIAAVFNKRIIFCEGDYDKTQFSDGFFDKIYGKATLHHSSDINQSLKELNRILKKGGVAVFQEPCRGFCITQTFAQRKYFKMPGMDPQNTQNENCFSYREWKRFFTSNGFKEVRLCNSLPLWYMAALLNLSTEETKNHNDNLLKTILRLRIINKLAIWLLKVITPLINLYMFLFGFPLFLPHEFTKSKRGFEYFTILILAKK